MPQKLRPALQGPLAVRFLHNAIHAMNVMCARDGTLLALFDWGDSGWDDPALELAQVPLGAVPFVLQGYESEAHLTTPRRLVFCGTNSAQRWNSSRKAALMTSRSIICWPTSAGLRDG